MKKIFYIIVIALSVIMISCGGAKKTETNDASAETSQVAEETTLTNDSVRASSAVINTPIHLTTAEFKKLVMNYDSNPNEWKYLGDKPAIIDFWATWCPPCKVIAPILDDLAKDYAGQIYIYKVDVDKEPQLASAFGIQSIPTLLFVPLTGDPKAEVGAIPKETFKERIDNFMLAKK